MRQNPFYTGYFAREGQPGGKIHAIVDPHANLTLCRQAGIHKDCEIHTFMKGIYPDGVNCKRCRKYLASDESLSARLDELGIDLPVGSYYFIDNFLKLDRQSDFEINLNFCLELANMIRRRPQYWKQMVFSFHNLFQAAMVANFADNNDGLYTKKVQKNIIKAQNQLSERFQKSGDPSERFTKEEIELLCNTRMESFEDLYRLCLRKQNRVDICIDQIHYLNLLRNDLVHYDGKLHMISFDRMRTTILKTIPALEALLRHQVAGSLCWNWDYDERYRGDVMKQDKLIQARRRTFYRKLDCLARLLNLPSKHKTMFPDPPHLHPPRG